MFRRSLLGILRPEPEGETGLELSESVEEDGYVVSGLARDPETGRTYPIKDGYLDLLGRKTGAGNVANLTNFLPSAGRSYEPLWRRRSLTLLTGGEFTNERELAMIRNLARADRGGLYLDLGCSAGLYSRDLATTLGDRGDAIGIDIAPSMLKEAARRTRTLRARAMPSLVRADAHKLPFADGSFAGAVCGGSLNEFGDPARVLRETRRVLAPGGRLAIMGLLRAATPRGRRLQRFLSTGGIHFFDPARVTSLLDHAGFDPDPLEVHNVVFFAGATRR
ncbi:MAG: methyltransferase domain-containing protein [Actinomycetota bacterium]|nr:methyltransferase domain-containing protein [Actinomycetota bacterium]